MENLTEILRQKFSHIHPVIFQRSVTKAKTDGELFDILDTIPEYPITWSETDRKWITDELLQSDNRKDS